MQQCCALFFLFRIAHKVSCNKVAQCVMLIGRRMKRVSVVGAPNNVVHRELFEMASQRFRLTKRRIGCGFICCFLTKRCSAVVVVWQSDALVVVVVAVPQVSQLSWFLTRHRSGCCLWKPGIG